MNIQLALDRLTISEAIQIGSAVRDYVDWIEVGTSLIKEFGIASIREISRAFPEKIIVADCKTFDNARYEFSICYEAGAHVATVMGAAPQVTIETCMEVAKSYDKQVMIDMLNTSNTQREIVSTYQDAIFCIHKSKDQQEASNVESNVNLTNHFNTMFHDSIHEEINANLKFALAGGISKDSIPALVKS